MLRRGQLLLASLTLCAETLTFTLTRQANVLQCAGRPAPRSGSRAAMGSSYLDLSESAVYFVMGGPGSGKGTQCAKLVEQFGFVHLSAGDLLRNEVSSGSEVGREIARIIEEGQIVKSEVTVGLLRDAMSKQAGPFLVDGFPRSLSNLEAFEAVFPPCQMMLFLHVSESEMEARLLKRGESSGNRLRTQTHTGSERAHPP